MQNEGRSFWIRIIYCTHSDRLTVTLTRLHEMKYMHKHDRQTTGVIGLIWD